MESKRAAEVTRKRARPIVEQTEEMVVGKSALEVVQEETEVNPTVSEQMELDINHILDKINLFTELVSELLGSGKSLLNELGNEFEERVILIHKEQVEKWQDDIKELRMLDASNEEFRVVLNNARYMLQTVDASS